MNKTMVTLILLAFREEQLVSNDTYEADTYNDTKLAYPQKQNNFYMKLFIAAGSLHFFGVNPYLSGLSWMDLNHEPAMMLK